MAAIYELAVIPMQTFSTILLLICLTNFAVGQSYSFDTTFISNKHKLHISTKDLNEKSVLLTATYALKSALHDTIEHQGLADIKFPDLNKDGYSDILLSYFGNNPTYFLYLFNPMTKQFKSIKGYMDYPDALQLKSNPKYYYSYHRAGCADANWVSDLFKIVNFRIVQVGHLYAQGCEFEVEKNPQEIKIYRVTNNNEEKGKLIVKLPYNEGIEKWGDKWDFIKNYWNKNYQKFD